MDDVDFDDIPALYPALARYGRPATLLNWVPGTPGREESSLGGPFLWPADEPWPVCGLTHDRRSDGSEAHPDGSAVHPVALLQLRSADAPGLRFPAGRDLLQLLWCPAPHEEQGFPAPVLVWRDSASLAETLASYPPVHRAQELHRPYPCVARPAEVLDFPHPMDLPSDLHKELFGSAEDPEQAEESYEELVAENWSDKVGGYAYFAQEAFAPACPACDGRMDLLVQLFSQRPFQDEVSRQADAIAATGVEPTPPADPETRIRFGRMQRLTVFACFTCPDLPTAHDVQ